MIATQFDWIYKLYVAEQVEKGRMKVNIKKLHDQAVIPSYAKAGDAGLDLTAISVDTDQYGNMIYGTGLAVEIPKGFVGLLFPRSSNSKTDLYLTNHVGVVDSGYRGEIMFKYRYINATNKSVTTTTPTPVIYKIGDRIGQLIVMPYPQIEFVEVEELSTSERGVGGFGSSGN